MLCSVTEHSYKDSDPLEEHNNFAYVTRLF